MTTTKTHTFLDHVKEHTPGILDIYQRYSKYDCKIVSQYCSPQKQAEDYDPNEEPSFNFEVDDPLIPDHERVFFSAKRRGVEIIIIYDFHSENAFREDHFMTHEDCLAYLEQLPRTWHTFTSLDPEAKYEEVTK